MPAALSGRPMTFMLCQGHQSWHKQSSVKAVIMTTVKDLLQSVWGKNKLSFLRSRKMYPLNTQ